MRTRWEYKVLSVGREQFLHHELEHTMGELGRHGWELVSTTGRERHGHSAEFFLFFKRVNHERDAVSDVRDTDARTP